MDFRESVGLFADWLAKRQKGGFKAEAQEPTPREWKEILKERKYKLKLDRLEVKRLQEFIKNGRG